ncbi:hypothetical protein [Microlunatus parietis]|uniref:Uncharacterized protein n=1 Tax=Microlunatus parietis TaxID=682979 RepID=A0A7Y9I214_9ACTN|nr:hypothetical protein [Microlunatus parietis]NYE68795.1 hypothetical protein [Microlunatus parietis]
MLPESPTTPDADFDPEQVDEEGRRVFEMPPGSTPETAQHPPSKRNLNAAKEEAAEPEQSG